MTNQSKGVLVSGVVTTSQNFDIDIPYGRGVRICRVITAEDGAATHDLKIQTYDACSGTYIDLAGAAMAQATGTGSATLTVYPGIAASANVSVNLPVARRIRVVSTFGGATSFTMSIGADILI